MMRKHILNQIKIEKASEFEKRVESTQYLSRLVESDSLFQRRLFQNTQPDSSRIVSNRSRLIIFCYQNQAIRLINLSHPKNSKAIRVQEVWKKKRFKTIGDFDQSIRDDSQDSNSFLLVFNTIAPENTCFSQTCHQTIRNDWDDSKRLETIGRDWKRFETIRCDSRRLETIRNDLVQEFFSQPDDSWVRVVWVTRLSNFSRKLQTTLKFGASSQTTHEGSRVIQDDSKSKSTRLSFQTLIFLLSSVFFKM